MMIYELDDIEKAALLGQVVELRDKLRLLGYDARVVNGDCFDVHQGGRIHYLSQLEAEALGHAGRGINLYAHSKRRGLNYWYAFPPGDAGDQKGGVMTTYLRNTGYQAYLWSEAGLCVHCGGKQDRSGARRCRYCDSCSEYWLADTLAEGIDGEPEKELCGECREAE